MTLSVGSATAAGNRIDLRALVVDDGSVWVKGITDQFTYEGVPFTTVKTTDANRPTIDASFLSSGTEAFFNAVVLPSDVPPSLSSAELTALSTFESSFGVRQVDAYNWANPTVGLNYAAAPNGFVGDITGMTATVTPAAQADGFGYLSGSLPVGVGTYAFIATPAGPGVMPAGGTFTPLVTLPVTGSSAPGSLVGVYANNGVEKLVITGAMSTTLSHFRLMAHGIVGWVTRGVHLGYNRNYLTFQFDDAFNYDARWDEADNCTPTEDCPSTVTTTTTPIRMTAGDVGAVVDWQNTNNYKVTLPFNASYTSVDDQGNPWPSGGDPLTNAFVAHKDQFIWLNHGYEHIFQGCVQDFSVIPWKCVLTSGTTPAADGSNISWVPQSAITSEIANNITRGQELGLPFDPKEYLSGEHSGLFLTPQQPVDNPNFAAALTAAGIRYIGADASREPGARVVGGATTVPRHPVAVYYNVSTVSEEIDEYNWFYNTRANGGGGYCEDNPGTATCLAAPLTAAGFTGYVVPTDAANDLQFILSNDPRPFYAHVSNLTGPDHLGLTLLTYILDTYRSVFTSATPVVNLTLTQASDVLTRQQDWADVGMGADPTVTGHVQDGTVTVTNPSGKPAPVTVPAGTTVNGSAFGESYGGELSGWVSESTTLQTGATAATSTTTTATGDAATSTTTTATGDAATTQATGGTTSTSTTGTAGTTSTGTTSTGSTTGTSGQAPTITSSDAATQTLTLTERPAFTSAASATATRNAAFSFTVTTTGYPAATLTYRRTLPSGISFHDNGDGTATLSGTPQTRGRYRLAFSAGNSAGTARQSFILRVN